MHQFSIVIAGLGESDNRQSADIERRAQRFVNALRSDCIIDHASCVVGLNTHDLVTMDARVDDPDAHVRRAYERYRKVRIDQEVMPKKIPPLWDDLDTIKQAAWKAAMGGV